MANSLLVYVRVGQLITNMMIPTKRRKKNMKKNWLKTTATFTMVGEAHLKGRKVNYANLVDNISDEQLAKFGAILSDLSGEAVQKIVVNNSSVIAE